MERKSALLALAVLCVLAAGGVSAASFTANNVSELRAHITTSNGNTGSDTITVVAGTFTLSGAAGENSNGSGDLDIIRTGGSLVIEGAGVGQTIIDGGNVDRVFHVNMSGGATVTFRDLTIQGGSAVDNGTNGSEAFRFVAPETDSNYGALGLGFVFIGANGVQAYVNYRTVFGYEDFDRDTLNLGARFEF